MTPTTTIPLPKDPRHQRFADLLLKGDSSLVDAYLAAGFKGDRNVSSNAKRVEKRADVKAYILAVRQASATSTVLSMQEKREKLARIVRVDITDIDIDAKKNTDVVKKYTVREDEKGTTITIEKMDTLKAIDLDNKLSGDDPETNALTAFTEQLLALGRGITSPIPTDKM